MPTPEERLEFLRRHRAKLLAEQEQVNAALQARLADSEYRHLARPAQLPPDGDWFIWMITAGRGFGKTWTGARWLRERVLTFPNTHWFIGNKTLDDIKTINIEGPAGFLAACEDGDIAPGGHNKSTGRIRMANGSVIHPISGEIPRKARGQNFAGGWADEIAEWAYMTTWTEGIGPALRVQLPNDHPRVIITTTPKPSALFRLFSKRKDSSIVRTRGSTFDNAANLSEQALEELRQSYEGTRLGRQELYGEELDDVEGALFTVEWIDRSRIAKHPDLTRIVIAIDPAVTSGPDSDETGIIIAGKGTDGDVYVIADLSGKYTPREWAHKVAWAFDEFRADIVIAEVNQGFDLVEANIRTVAPRIPYKSISAKRGKALRAQPVAGLYEQNRVHHVGDAQQFAKLEEQQCSWVPDSGMPSPDRLDALVYAVTDLSPASSGAADRFFAEVIPACWRCGHRNAKDAEMCGGCGQILNLVELDTTRLLGLNQ